MSADIDALIAEFAVQAPTGRTPQNIYSDFRQTFLATDAGQRVLHDILRWGHVWQSSHVRGDAYQSTFYEGGRFLALRILKTINIEPDASPTQQQTREDD